MNLLTLSVIVILLIISLFHFYWALGGKLGLDKALPTKNGIKLLNPSKSLTFLVALFLLGFAFIILQLLSPDINAIYIYFSWVISFVFFIRAIGDFNMIGFFKKIKETEFANYDTKFFIPLSLYLGFSIALSVYSNSN